MKKVLSTVAALALVAGVASNAMALDKPGRASEVPATTAPRVPTPTAPGVALWSVAGQWVLAGALIGGGVGDPNSGGADVKSDFDNTDAWYIYSFKILPVLQVNDKISMKGEVRFADRCVFGTSCGSSSSERDADFKHVYMEWVTPYGKTRFGRTPAGAWGPKFMNNGSQGDRIMWWPNFMPDNWGALIFTQKISEKDSQTSGMSDGDTDGYYVDVNYKADFGKTIAALWVAREADVAATDSSVTTTQFRLTGNYKFGDFGIEYEWNQNFGDGTPEGTRTSKSDSTGTGLMADLSYKMDDFTFGALFFYMSGDDDPTDNERESLMGSKGVGNDYNPYQILTGDYMGLLQGDKTDGGAHRALFADGVAGVISIGGYLKWNVSPKLTIGGEIGYAEADEAPYNYDDDFGVEFGVGLGYKIMDNLQYNAHFSFLATGDYWKEDGNPVFESSNDDVYLIAHALSMKF